MTEIIGLNKLKKIPQFLIDEANSLAIENNTTMVIYDSSDKKSIDNILRLSDLKGLNKNSKSKNRDNQIDLLFDFYIESASHLQYTGFPSQPTYYDTITKSTILSERHAIVAKFLIELGFISSFSDRSGIVINTDIEVAYIHTIDTTVIIRVKPNLLVNISIVENDRSYTFFYDPIQIFNILVENSTIEISRDLKLNYVLKGS